MFAPVANGGRRARRTAHGAVKSSKWNFSFYHPGFFVRKPMRVRTFNSTIKVDKAYWASRTMQMNFSFKQQQQQQQRNNFSRRNTL